MLRVVAPFLAPITYCYFQFVHFVFWLYNYLFKARLAVPRPAPDDVDQLLLISAAQAAEMIRKREISAVQLIDVYIRRIELVNPYLNAVVQQNFEEALDEAKKIDDWLINVDVESEEYKSLADTKPLLGVPFTVKDSIRIKGHVSTAGIPALSEADPNPEDAAVVTLLKASGAIPLAVTNVPEACLWWQSCNGVYGQTNSPYDSRRGVGGSSGGEGCLISAAGSVVGVGSDIGGSVRIPAFFNGVFGLKPTPGLIPTKGHIPDHFYGYQEEMFSIGPICRYARDLSLMLKVMVGPDATERLQLNRQIKLQRTRVFFMNGLNTLIASPVHSDCSRALKKAVKYFEKKYDIHAYNVNFPITHHALDIWLTSMHSTKQRFADVLAGYKENSGFNPLLQMLYYFMGNSKHMFMSLLTAFLDDHLTNVKRDRDFVHSKRDQLRREVVNLLGQDGILIFPGFPRPAYFHNESVFTPFDYQYTALWNAVGLPVVTCPMGLNSNGLPVGVQIVGGEDSEALLIAVAQDLEEGFGGWKAPVFG
ncbi:unnamed protein product [Bursaphelenchus okinawaensis]|uniref:Amidase domain-containing protein n=1 Tax=Bursaphelenchus okinawaensis TaxID=465554 RepID=A0A811JUD0_9BILA|nr:unnamed protein product [Bursaphelenchus okinawaensis]CAG9083336.1 unnamed protein product [Bursaphelenchus okinawaensis]